MLRCTGLFMAAPFYVLLCCAAAAKTPSGPAADAIAAICDAAGARASQATGVPLPVLQAISLTETGRKLNGRLRPWPWTVNMEGKGIWFDTREEALAYVQKHHARGARSYDVGCFQINYRWHGKAFKTVADMFEPDLNALYAGRFLSSLYAETRSWTKSAGAYHSRTPKFAKRYSARFSRIIARLTGKSAEPMEALAQPGVIPDVPPPGEPLSIASYLPQAEPQAARVPPPDGPDHWVPPPPSATGSVAAIGLVPRATGLLRQANGSLF